MKKTAKTVILEDVRLFFVNLISPTTDPFGNTTYSAQVLLKKDSESYKKLLDIISEVKVEAFGKIALTSPKYKDYIKDGDEMADEQLTERAEDIANGKISSNILESTRGHYVFNIKNKQKCIFLNKYKEVASDEEVETWAKNGSYVNLSLNIFAFDRNGNKGVSQSQRAIMFLERGTFEGNKPTLETSLDEFSNIATSEKPQSEATADNPFN